MTRPAPLAALALPTLVLLLATPVAAEPPPLAPPSTAEHSDSGLAWVVLTPPTDPNGMHPSPADYVEVEFSAWDAEGQLLDSSERVDRPVVIQTGRALEGWYEALLAMREGERRRLWVPEDLAYRGEEGKPRGPLVFDLELRQVIPAPEPPTHLAAAPPEATEGRAGLAWVVLAPGTGTESPKRNDRVRVHYTGWDGSGEIVDSSVLRGQAAEFPLGGVIKGWRMGLQEMVVGEKRRFWIPGRLAYDGVEGKPQGMLVFDIELLAVLD